MAMTASSQLPINRLKLSTKTIAPSERGDWLREVICRIHSVEIYLLHIKFRFFDTLTPPSLPKEGVVKAFPKSFMPNQN
jgi:hypothetical protein